MRWTEGNAREWPIAKEINLSDCLCMYKKKAYPDLDYT